MGRLIALVMLFIFFLSTESHGYLGKISIQSFRPKVSPTPRPVSTPKPIVSPTPMATPTPNATPTPAPIVQQSPIRGVDLFYLDGINQGLPYVIENLNNPIVLEKLKNQLTDLKAGGVTWVRYHLAAQWYGRMYFKPGRIFPDSDFIGFTKDINHLNSILKDMGFNVEMMLIPYQDSSKWPWPFTETFPYDRHKTWFSSIFQYVDMSKVDLFMIAGDLDFAGSKAHIQWASEILKWMKINYPNIKASVETVSGWTPYATGQIAKVIQYYFADLPLIGVSFYLTLPGSPAQKDWENLFKQHYTAFEANTKVPLWIDEVGHPYKPQNISEQTAYINGFLAVSSKYPKFIWVSGNDTNPNDPLQSRFGLIDHYDGTTPIYTSSWEIIKNFFKLP